MNTPTSDLKIASAASEDWQAEHQRLLARHLELMESNEWINNSGKNRIRSYILHPADGTISIVRAESVVNTTAQKLFDYLITNIDETCTEWNDVMLYSGKIREVGPGMELSRIISEGHAVADREDVFLRCTGAFDDGRLYEVSVGFGEDQEPIYTGISKYTVRSEMHFASKEFVPMEDGTCLYKTIWHYDPSGWLSKLIPRKTFGKLILKNLVHEHQKLAAIFTRQSHR